MADAAAFDAKRLIADIRKGDRDAVERAYAQVFDNELGRLVLADHLTDCGVGSVFGAGLSDADLRYAVGRHDAAIALAARIYDAAALAVAVMTDNLEGSTTDEHAHHLETRPAGDGGHDEFADEYGG